MNLKRLLSISTGHLTIDILNSSVYMILTAVAIPFGLSLSQIGLGALIYTLVGSLTQPFFGAWADRLRGRWLGPLGLLWTLSFYMLVPFAPNYPMLITCLTFGALGSAALHAVGMIIASDAGGARPTTATSIFFVLGQSGLALGPSLSGLVLNYWGLRGLPILAVFAIVPALVMFFLLREPVHYDPTAAGAATADTGRSDSAASIKWGVIGAFVLLIVLRAATMQTYTIFLPKFLEDRGYLPGVYGFMVGIFVFGGAIGTFLGGMLGDKFSRRLIIFTSSVLAVPFCYLFLGADGWLYYAAAALAGGLLNISHSILIVMAQALLPRQKGMMGGATLGFMFASGATAAWLAGLAADQVGLSTVLYTLAFAPVLAGASALLLPSTRKPAPVPLGSPQAAPGD
ncbi:MAG: MFS transporter [Caldilineaceae bacterium]